MVVGGVGGNSWGVDIGGFVWGEMDCYRGAGESEVRKFEISLSGVWECWGRRGMAGRWSWGRGVVRGGGWWPSRYRTAAKGDAAQDSAVFFNT